MLDPKEEKLIQAVDAAADEIFDFAARLTAEPSTLGNEESALAVMAEELTRLGYPPQKIRLDSEDLLRSPGYAPTPWEAGDRYCLASVRPADGEGGRSALFNGHLDVVSPEPVSFWSRPPFEAAVEDGRLHGRGAGDMKSGVAAMTYAAAAVDRAGFGLRAPVTVNAVIEEECSGNGALASVLAGYDADAVLIPEPFGPTLYTAQVGVLWFRVDVSGAAVHVQAAGAGSNAIEKSFPLIQALRGLEEEMNSEERPAPYRDVDHPLNLNIGVINGGDWPSTVPAETSFHGRLSFFPGTDASAVKERIRRTVAAAAAGDPWLGKNPPRVEFYGFRSEGHVVDRGLPALQTLSGCRRDLAGAPAAEYVSTCTTDLRAFVFFGRGQATCYGPAAVNIHGADESVDLESVLHTARAYALFLARWCELTE